MDLHIDGLRQDMYGHMLPNLHHDAYEHPVEDEFEAPANEGYSENDDSEYDDGIDEDEFDDEEEDEEEDENSEDDSQMNALIDDLEIKFQLLVAAKIDAAERFFDEANALQRPISHSTLTERGENSSEFLLNLNQVELDEAQGSTQAVAVAETNVDQIITNSLKPQFSDACTQTEDDKAIQTQLSIQPCRGAASDPLTAPEKARHEISQLRDVRESFVSQRREWATQLKQIPDVNEDDFNNAESKIYELETAIEAVDTAIEFKNQVVLGQPMHKIIDNITPGTNEAELVTRLESMSLEELQRLLCVYFAKVVELRSASRKLEKQLENAESTTDNLSRRLKEDQKRRKEVEQECNARIRLFLSSHNINAALRDYLRQLEESLSAARKKQHDLEKSLTALLVRHGYLVDGADYDVKQVVRMLGIEGQLASTSHKPPDGMSVDVAGQLPYSRQWEDARGWPRATKNRHAGLGHRRNGRQLDGHELQRLHKDTKPDGWEKERHRDRGQLVQPTHPPEVRREKHRLIIQPSNPVAPSYVHPHHGSPNNHHHPHHHHPHHQPSHGHGYK